MNRSQSDPVTQVLEITNQLDSLKPGEAVNYNYHQLIQAANSNRTGLDGSARDEDVQDLVRYWQKLFSVKTEYDACNDSFRFYKLPSR